uniref:ATP synthase complex subunit 8 n=1 Tax=Deporaus marginatus TaxID=1544439 RepID=A0A7G7WQ75_9CUCU|nr:ATP synthase F0 subunit 8 [Deporaus marginatus]QNH68702.1 ATP synthase subunit 8 [Deporaus marginatus]
MPQMAPLNWLSLYIFFIIIFMIFNMLNYFSFNYPVKSSKHSKKMISYNWKW